MWRENCYGSLHSDDLHSFLQREYFKQLHERHDEKINQKQQDECVFLETQRQNAEYEEMMAKMRAQNRAQIQHDLGTQIKLKDLEMV